MTVRLTLVRHGRTEWNADRRLLGWTDVPLDDVGSEQAVELGRRVGRSGHDAAWSSDLRRAADTARLAGWEPFGVDRRLREIDFGGLEGRTWSDLDRETASALAEFDGFVAPGGESTATFVARVTEFLDELGAGSHLLVTHGGVIRAVLRLCGESGAFPGHGTIYTVDWAGRRLVEVQTPTD